MSEFNDRVERVRTLIKLMKLLPEDILFLLESAEEDEEQRKLLNEVILELLHLSANVQRAIAAKMVRYYGIE